MGSSGLLTFISFLSGSVTPGTEQLEEMSYPLEANETYQSNPIDNTGYVSQVGSTPSSYATLTANVAMTLYYDTSSDALSWTEAVHTYSYSPSSTQTFTAAYPGVEYCRFRLVNGSTGAATTNLIIGLS